MSTTAVSPLVTERELRSFLRIKAKQTLETWLKKGYVPPPVFHSGRKRLWDLQQVRDHLERRAAEVPHVA